MDVRQAIKTQPMRSLQILAIAICLIITMIDGYEILVMAFVAPYLAKAWKIGPVEIGYLLSAGVFGMAAGAIFISPFADKIGRRLLIIICLVLIAIGMYASVFTTTVTQLAAARAFSGLWMGGIVASLNVMVSEYASDKRRGTAMGIYGIGFPLGVTLGGAVSAWLIASWGWQAPFIFAGTLTVIMLFVTIMFLPESIEYLIEKRPAGALEAYNKIAARLGYQSASELPAPRGGSASKSPAAAIFKGVMARRTMFLWIAFAMLTAAFYFANTWTPKLIADATKDPALGVRAGVLVASGGVIGAFLFAGLTAFIRPRLVTALIMFAGAVAFVLYANNFQSTGLAFLLAVLVGCFANGGIAAYYGISPSIYPAAVRSTAVGLMIGFGRAVSIIAPIFTGYLLAAGWTPPQTYQLFAGALVIAGIACLGLDFTYRGLSEDPETPEAKA